MNYRRLNPNFAFKALTVCHYFKIISNEAEFIIKKILWLDFFLKEIKENIWSIQIQEAIPKNSLKKYQWLPDIFQKSRWIHKLINLLGKGPAPWNKSPLSAITDGSRQILLSVPLRAAWFFKLSWLWKHIWNAYHALLSENQHQKMFGKWTKTKRPEV